MIVYSSAVVLLAEILLTIEFFFSFLQIGKLFKDLIIMLLLSIRQRAASLLQAAERRRRQKPPQRFHYIAARDQSGQTLTPDIFSACQAGDKESVRRLLAEMGDELDLTTIYHTSGQVSML